uniref:C2H2-type domain-containing protein n=1 Tax=Timema poppense TaxID=170557 RepID=A0A7R9CXX5_TIMPO|nr:unnamed protein product [Timema poppensis]
MALVVSTFNSSTLMRCCQMSHTSAFTRNGHAECFATKDFFWGFSALKIHSRIVHQPQKNVKHHCSLCVACFNTQGNLLRHFLSVHQELRRFICGLCGSRYSQNQVLRRHLLQVHQVQIDSISSFDKKSVMRNSPSRYYTLKIEKGHLDMGPGFDSRVQV